MPHPVPKNARVAVQIAKSVQAPAMSYSILCTQHSFPYWRDFPFIYSQSRNIELPFLILCANSIPPIVIAAFSNFLNPSIG